MSRLLPALAVALALAGPAPGPHRGSPHSIRLPTGYSIPPIARSPDGRYGVLVPDLDHYDWGQEQNKLADMRTGRILAVIHGHSGALHANHVEIELGNWSADRSLFLWRVAGKWSPTALVLLKLRSRRVVWQLDVLGTAQRAILARTRKARPLSYRAAVRQNDGNGAAFPDGFTVDVRVSVEPGKPLVMPLRVTASLTSNPKAIEDYPKEAEVNSELTATLAKDGRFRVTRFRLTGPRRD